MEFRRVFNRNTCLILVAVVMISMLFYYLEFRDDMKQEEYYVGMVRHYQNSKDSKDPILDTIRSFYAEYSEDVKQNKEVYRLAREQLEHRVAYVDRYPADILSKIRSAKTMLTLNLFNDMTVYEKRNLNKNIVDLNQLTQVEVVVDRSRAFDALFEYELASYMLIMMVLITVYRFLKEKKNSITELVHSTKYGRLRLNLIRIVMLLVVSVLYSVVLYTATLSVGAMMFGGFGDLGNSLQSSSAFSVLNFIGSRMDFLIYYVVMSGIMAFTIGMVFWAATNIFVSYQIGITAVGIGIAAQAVLYYVVSVNSIVRFLHYINVFLLINSKHVLCTYENWGYSAFILSVRDTMLIIAVVLLVVSVALLSMYCVLVRPVRSVSKIEAFLDRLSMYKMRLVEHFPAFLKEVYKSLIPQKGLIFIIIVIILVLDNRIGGYLINSELNISEQFYNSAQGLELGDELDEIINIYEKRYNMEVGSQYGDTYEKLYKALLDEANMHKSYLLELKERNIDGQVIFQAPYEALMGYQARGNQQLYALFAMLAVVMLCFGIESYERQCKTREMIASTSGRERNKRHKITMVIIYAIATGIFIYGLNWYDILRMYDLICLDAPIQSVHIMENFPLRISIQQYFLLIGVLRVTILVILALAVYHISRRFSYYGSLGVSIILLTPQIMVLCGVDIVKYISIGTLLTKMVF